MTLNQMSISRWLLWLCLIVPVYTHVALTFPPARKLALDFLDNARTPRPCGMPKGLEPVTSFRGGNRIMVTWNTAYVHQGGFFIEIINSTNQTVIRSPLSGYGVVSDPTRSFHPLTLPLQCNDCTLRIVRQALEWNSKNLSYIFWSCSDINIVKQLNPRLTCLNGGQEDKGACQCKRLYTGTNCQNKDDCVVDIDCNAQGKCHDTTSMTYPRHQCFCQAGWFGKLCERASKLTKKLTDYKAYTHTGLSAGFDLYYRILHDAQEVEVVIRVKSQTWVAIGIRPKGNASDELPLPNPGPDVPNSKDTESTPKPEHEPIPESTAEPEKHQRLHPMDKTDIVIGTAWGNYGRVGDYYTRDRSTPQRDDFYGGSESLTSALAYEDGEHTVVMFRKPLTATENTDYNITDSTMHVIWARGQETSYYRRDELKYHGKGQNRGSASINFFETTVKPDGANNGSWTVTVDGKDFNVKWRYRPEQTMLDFEYSVKIGSAKIWVALGFSLTTAMQDTDLVVAWLNSSQRAVVSDRWIPGYSAPRADPSADLHDTSVTVSAGVITVSFSRNATTDDTDRDYQFSEKNCPYVIHAVGGGYDETSGAIYKHPSTPTVSKAVCFVSSSGHKSTKSPTRMSATSTQVMADATVAAALAHGAVVSITVVICILAVVLLIVAACIYKYIAQKRQTA